MNQLKKPAFYESIQDLKLAKSVSGLKFYLSRLFKEINLEGKNILDVGAGAGVYSCYMAMNGAKEVIGLEPEIEGSRNNYISKFDKLKEKLELGNVFLKPLTFQSFDNAGEKFDIILLHYSINHLNENACIDLRRSNEAKNTYKEIFDKLYSISNDNADIIVADCSNKNFFNLLGLKNPFAPTIEWHKHQSPEEWIEILRKAGFKNFKIKWVSPNQLGKIGDFLLGNKICSFFVHSHFIIYAKK
jgi:SAM-dependent methyltransferase